MAVLIDFDLATYPPFDKGPISDRSTGTAPFMAYELLDDLKCEQTLQHDLESCIHCVFWNGAGYSDIKRSNAEVPRNYPRAMTFFRDWRVGSRKEMGLAKHSFYTSSTSGDYIEYLTSINAKYADICDRLVSLLRAEYGEYTGFKKGRTCKSDSLFGPRGPRLKYASFNWCMKAARREPSCNAACCQ